MGDIEPDILKAINQGLHLHIKAYKPENPWTAIKRQFKESLEKLKVAAIILLCLIIFWMLSSWKSEGHYEQKYRTEKNTSAALRDSIAQLDIQIDSMKNDLEMWEEKYEAAKDLATERKKSIRLLNGQITRREQFNDESVELLTKEINEEISQLQSLVDTLRERQTEYQMISIDKPTTEPTPAPGSP